MRVLGILQFEDIDPHHILSRLPKKEEERLYNKGKKYILSSGIGRLLLFSLCDKIFGEGAYKKEISYREHPHGKGKGAPYIPSLEGVHLSISHAEGVCAVFLSDEGQCGVDIESTASVESINENRIDLITKRFYLDHFLEIQRDSCDDIITIVYKLNENYEVIEENDIKPSLFFAGEKTNSKTKFLFLYTRMEAIGKAFGLGVSFLPERKKYKSMIKGATLFHPQYILSLVQKK